MAYEKSAKKAKWRKIMALAAWRQWRESKS